jgi:hypothetical protein
MTIHLTAIDKLVDTKVKYFMRILLLICFCSVIWLQSYAQNAATVSGPDGHLKLNVSVKNGLPVYSVMYKGKVMLEDSPLGLVTNEGDFSSSMENLLPDKLLKNTTRKRSNALTSSIALTP